VLDSLDEILEPVRCALVVVDMQNDAVLPGGKFAEAGNDISSIQEIVPRCAGFIGEARAAGVLVVHVRTLTLANGLSDSPSWIRAKQSISGETEWFLEGSWGAEFCEGCRPQPGEPVVTKHRASAFRNTDLDQILRGNSIETVVVIGEQTPGCVEATYRDAAYHDYYNVLIEDCVAAFDRELHEASLKIQRARHDVCHSDEALAIWQRHRRRAESAHWHPHGVEAHDQDKDLGSARRRCRDRWQR
jgi:nicotinamidase-related amidase